MINKAMLHNKQLSFLICAILFVCAAIVSTITLYVLVISHWHGPFRDMWEIYPFLKKIIYGSWSLSDLWESYGYSHRLFIPKLLFVADHQFFGATNHLLISISVVCQIFICFLFALLILNSKPFPAGIKYGLIFVVICLQFSATLLFNFMHTFDVQWFVCCFFIVTAFYSLSHLTLGSYTASDRSVIPCLVISGVFIIAACLSNFSAMAGWPIWLALIFIALRDLKLKIILAMVAILFIIFYTVGIRSVSMSHGSILDWIKIISYVFVTFPLAYLSNPLSDIDFLPFGNWGMFIVFPALYVLLHFWWRILVDGNIKNKDRLKLFLACIGLFGYGVAVVTAIGRGYDPNHVRALRYQNIVMLFWSAVILLTILELYTSVARGNKSKYILLIPCIIVFAGFMWCQFLSWNQNIRLGYQVNRAHLALMMGFSKDVPMIAPTVSRSMIYVSGYNLERERLLYEQVQKGIYHGDLANLWLKGVSLTQIQQECRGVSWVQSPYKGLYSNYISFSVFGDTADFNVAVLVDEAGRVNAMAIQEGADSLIATMENLLGFKTLLLKGFAVSDNKPFALVMLRSSVGLGSCKVLLGPSI